MQTGSEESKAATEAAKAARTKATEARQSADAAGGADEALNATAATLEAEAVTLEAKAADLSQTPLQKENNRRKPKTELEKAQFALKQNAERLRQLGGDPTSVLGAPAADPIDPEEQDDEDDSKPLTRGDLKRIEKKNAQKTAKETALSIADAIEDADERAYVRGLIEDGKIAVGTDPNEAIRLARLAANSVRNGMVVEEVQRKGQTAAREFPSGSGQPARPAAAEPELTAEEQTMMRPPYNLSKKAILDARAGVATGFPTTQ